LQVTCNDTCKFRRAVSFFVDNWILFFIAITSGTMLLWPMVGRGGGALSVGTAEAVRLINREKGVVIDVSEPAEYAAGHAAGARNVPLGKLDGAKELPTNKTLPVILICASGARSSRAAAQLRKAGHEKAVSLAGGIGAWREAGFPVDKSA
jgi:rhodanese-related sulfurtransferase